MTVCLVIDEKAAECFPTALRYLQIGLIDEPVDAVLVVSEQAREVCLAGGPASVISWREGRWPFAQLGLRSTVEAVKRRVANASTEGTVVVHGLSLSAAPLSEEIVHAVGGRLTLTVTIPSEITNHAVNRSCRNADMLITPTKGIQQEAGRSCPAGPTVEHIPVGVVSTLAPAAFADVQRPPSLVYVGPLSADCGVECLLRAAKSVLTNHPNLLVFIVGKGSAEGGLRRLADSLELSSSVTFTGKLEHWRLALQAADVFCAPVGRQAFREEPIHALAAGVALAASTDCACDGLVDGETALFFPPGDHLCMAQQISRLIEDQRLARRLASAGQSHARSNNSVARMVSEHVRVYQQLGGQHQIIPMPLPG